MSPFCNDILEYLQNYKCCMNGILEVLTEKDMVEALRIRPQAPQALRESRHNSAYSFVCDVPRIALVTARAAFY